MAGALEVGKLVTASWLYRYWDDTKWFMKTYLTIAVIVLMLITSMGIFGYLSKAHLDQAAEVGNNSLKITTIQQQIDREQRSIDDAEGVVAQLDQAVSILQEYDRIRGPEGALAVRESQKDERAKLSLIINEATDNILEFQSQMIPLRQAEIQTELKVGPIKYVAELIYGDTAENQLDRAVRLFILMLVFVFDPLAIAMVIAANQTLLRYGINLEPKGPDPEQQLEEILEDFPETDSEKKRI